jgi:hypothetical protein
LEAFRDHISDDDDGSTKQATGFRTGKPDGSSAGYVNG